MATRPSSILGIRNRWAAYCLDRAVYFAGNIIEGAANEVIEIGDPPKLRNRFHLSDLLEAGFRIPNLAEEQFLSDFRMLRGMPGIQFDEVKH